MATASENNTVSTPSMLSTTRNSLDLTHKMTSCKLDESNYLVWSRWVKLYITGKGKIGYLTGSKACPGISDPTYETWVEENALIMSWLIDSISPELRSSFMLLTTAKELWDAVSQIYVVTGNATQIYELNRRVIETRQNNRPLSVYYNALQSLWQELDSIQPCDIECVADTTKLKKRIEKGRIIELLANLDSDFDPIRIQILGKDPLPTLREVYGIIRSEELRRVAMPSQMAQESSALKTVTTSTQVVTVTSGNNRQPDEKDSLYCDYCNKRRHTRETCFKLNGRPQRQSGNWRGGFSSGNGGGRRGGRNGGLRAYHTADEGEFQPPSLTSANVSSHPSQDQLEQMIKNYARMLSAKEHSAGSSSSAQSGSSHRGDDWSW